MAVVIVLCVVSLAKRCPRGCGATLLQPLWTKIVRGAKWTSVVDPEKEKESKESASEVQN